MARNTDLPERPYLDTPALDQLARMNTELLSELWILRDRVLVLEHLLAKAGVVAEEAVSEFVPDESFGAKLQADRDELVARVVGAPHRSALDLEEIRRRGVAADGPDQDDS